MPARRMRVELFDSDGNKYSIAFEGQITRDKALRLLDLVELLGGVPSGTGNLGRGLTKSIQLSKFDRVRNVVQKSFPIVWFSTRDIQTAYEQEQKEPIGVSTVATYLARMSERGLLLKSGAANSLRYKSVSPSQTVLKQQTAR